MGAFEDRLAAGYRAANTPAETSQTTTPTEALARALKGAGLWPQYPAWADPVREYAAAALDALPPGWRLVGPDDVTVKAEYISVRDPDDEIVGYGYFHVERMDDDSVWVGLGTGPSVHLWLTYAKGRKVAMTVSDERPDNDPTVRDLPQETLDFWKREGAAAERRRLLEIHMADHDDATGWCPTCALLTEDER